MNTWKMIPVILVTIIAFALLVHPTLYYYTMYDGKLPVKINRITGKAQMLGNDGWHDMSK
jgi:hypothetical protein